MDEEQKKNKQKLTVSFILFIIALVLLVTDIILLILNNVGSISMPTVVRAEDGPWGGEDVPWVGGNSPGNTGDSDASTFRIIFTIADAILLPVSLVILAISAYFNLSYRKCNTAPEKLSLAMYIIDWILACPAMLFMYGHFLSTDENTTDEDKKAFKKLKTIAAMIASSLIGLAVGIIFLIIGNAQDIVALTIVGGSVLLSGSYVVFLIAGILNALYRRECREDGRQPEKLCTAIYVVSWVYIVIAMIIMLVIAIFMGTFASMFGSRNTKEVKAKDDKGKEHTLNPTYSGFITEYYKDQDGNEWQSTDGGQTFNRLVKEATVKDENGNEYRLTTTVPTAGSGNFTDQNGDKWWTNDGGKTFTRL